MIKFPSIDQFRTVVSNINRHYNFFVGLDEYSGGHLRPHYPNQQLLVKNYMELMPQYL
jgi:hypothetical protein